MTLSVARPPRSLMRIGVLIAAFATPLRADDLTIAFGINRSAVSISDGVLIDPRWSPLLDVSYRHDRLFIDSENGIGYKLLALNQINAGIALNYLYGRHAAADARYRGMGDIDGSAGPSLFFEWEPIASALDIYAQASKASGASRGILYKLEISGGVPVTSAVNFYVDFDANAGDSRYARSYYGVDAAQTVASGYVAYRPDAGWLLINSSLGMQYRFSRQLNVNLQTGTLRYLDSAANSPLVSKLSSSISTLFVTYTY